MKKSNSLPIYRSLQATTLAAALIVSLGTARQTRAAAFQLPVTHAAGFGRAFAGGSLWPNDPSSAYNNPAAMAWFTAPVMQGSWIGIHVSAQFHGVKIGRAHV